MHPIHHIGIAVPELDIALQEYLSRWGGTAGGRETLVAQEVELAFVITPTTRIELLAPLSNGGPIAKFLATRGAGLHHVCFEVCDIVAELSRLKTAGVRLIDEQPRKGAHGALVAFLHPKSCGGVLTELCQPQTA